MPRTVAILVFPEAETLDMALHVVARLHGEEHARATAREMEFTWTPC